MTYLLSLIRFIVGLVGIILSLGMILVSMVLIVSTIGVGLSDQPVDVKSGMVLSSLFFIWSTVAHFNMWWLYERVRRHHDGIARHATDGRSYAFFIGSSPRALYYIHQWVRRLQKGEFGRIQEGLEIHAKFTLMINLLLIWYVCSGQVILATALYSTQ